ncbi:hypothetical protein BC938DRAFT_474952 [Jimgerdemannia flammicorona]|uniref:Uncharacterized protein n=1 Tax=Jimgerdemannia flammicorona TaxID=994334 RepID=A0A433Q168_9FUNG|nr:hypothetical protein BC938DRAFT_474952 [Jimgerdemannia flammicorona]
MMDTSGQAQHPQPAQPAQPYPLLDSYESSEHALMASFKAAAFSVTQLYKDSLRQNRRAYAAGYEQCLQDLYGFLTSHPATLVSSDQSAIPVQDLLNFARSKNAQLQSEAHKNNDQDVSSAPQPAAGPPPSAVQTLPGMSPPQRPAPQQQQQQQHQPSHKPPTPTTHHQFGHTQLAFNHQQQQHQQQQQQQPGFPALFNPDIAQFTFSFPTVPQALPGADDLGGLGQQQPNGGENPFKRRYTAPPTEFMFLGRSMNTEQYGNNYEPPCKRRARREEM